MQGTVLFSGVFLGAVVATSAWGPQQAEILVSDEIWRMLNVLLHDSNDMHFSLCSENPMQRLSIVRNDAGDLYLMSRLVAYPTEIRAYRLAMLEARQLLNSALAASIRNPARNGHDGATPEVQIEVAAVDRRAFEIVIYEQIRAGKSADDREIGAKSPDAEVDNREHPNPLEATLAATSDKGAGYIF